MGDLFYRQQCGSTMDEILPLLSPEAPAPFALYTLNQTGGRGNYGKTWDSEPGRNIAITFAIPAMENHPPSIINYYTALCVRSFLADLSDAEVKIKWPNDIIISNKKICGILLEAKKIGGRDFLLAGIGLNVLQEDFGALPRAGSLKTSTGRSYQPQRLAESLFLTLSADFQNIAPGEIILGKFNKYLYKRGEVAAFSTGGGIQNGIILCAEADGHLLINLEKDGPQRFYYKEIEMLY